MKSIHLSPSSSSLVFHIGFSSAPHQGLLITSSSLHFFLFPSIEYSGSVVYIEGMAIHHVRGISVGIPQGDNGTLTLIDGDMESTLGTGLLSHHQQGGKKIGSTNLPFSGLYEVHSLSDLLLSFHLFIM